MHEPHSSGVRRITHFVRVEVVMVFQSLILTFLPPLAFQCCNYVQVSMERITTLKRGRGGLAINKKVI